MVTCYVNDLMNGRKCCLDERESQILVRWLCTVGHCVHPTLAFLQVLATDGPCGLAFKCSVLGLFFASHHFSTQGEKQKKSQHLGASAAPCVRLPWRWEHTGVPDNESILIITLFQQCFYNFFLSWPPSVPAAAVQLWRSLWFRGGLIWPLVRHLAELSGQMWRS